MNSNAFQSLPPGEILLEEFSSRCDSPKRFARKLRWTRAIERDYQGERNITAATAIELARRWIRLPILAEPPTGWI